MYLSDEMLHAEAYARIQESRFSTRIRLIWEKFPEEARDIRVPRLIVQPILENAFKYGLEEKEEGGILHVRCRIEQEILLISIEDNGEVSEVTVRSMQKMLSEDYHGEVTGLINVHRRLRGYYRQNGGITVSRGAMGGILVIMEIPVEKGGRDNAAAVDC